MKATDESQSLQLDGFLYRESAPGGDGWMWIIHSTTGHVSHGRTPELALDNLKGAIAALAESCGQSPEEWLRSQRSDTTRVLRRGEILQA
jgi:predicted RNase H-like HicB family nuclease